MDSDPGEIVILDGNDPPRRRGLSVRGLMILVAVAGSLSGLLVWGFFSARGAAHQALCINNLKQIGLALLNYQSSYDCLPPAITTDARGQPMHSWRLLMLPYYDTMPTYNSYNMNEPWDGPSNSTVLNTQSFLLLCPSETRQTPPNRTDYMVVTGPGTAFPGPNQSVNLNEMIHRANRQGRSPLPILAIEVVRSRTHWLQPGDLELDKFVSNPNDPGRTVPGSGHGSFGVQAVLLDGRVITIPRNTTPAQLRAMCILAPEDSSPH